MSRVLRTEPSIEFSKGTSARSASPRSTATIASWTVAVRSGSKSRPPARLAQGVLGEGAGRAEVGDLHRLRTFRARAYSNSTV